MLDCYIALGGNLGEVAATFDLALNQLECAPGVQVALCSRVHSTAPVGNAAGPTFMNAAARLVTGLPPLAVLDLLQAVEANCGRTRDTHWGPRTLDLDVLFYGREILESARLVVPHPACWYRRFVLDPLVEIAADVRHPVKQLTVGELHARLLERPLHVSLAGGSAELRRQWIESLEREFGDVLFSTWEAAQALPREPTLVAWLGGTAVTPRDAHNQFLQLPPVSRVDASGAAAPFEFLRQLTQSIRG